MERVFQLLTPRSSISSSIIITYHSIIAFFLIISFLVSGLIGECPNLCECKWKNGKESVLCLNANLSHIPGRLDGGTQVLDLTGNDISNIPHDAFSNAHLLNLQKIYLSKCRLKIIERYAFRKLNNLVELDLSYNFLTMIPSHSFDSISELREIKLNGNPISKVLNEAFIRIPQLIRLDLSDCKIATLERRAFVGLESSLEWLKLDGNKLIEIWPTTITILTNLHGLELARNPWNCSCKLRPLRAWMLKENIPYSIPPTCKSPPRLSGRSWDKADLDDFACVPHIIASDSSAYGVEGKNITMTCLVEGIPEPNVRWIVKNRVIANLSGEASVLPATQGRKMYMVNLMKNESNLTIITADVQDAGIYTCLAENKAGRVEASVTLAVSKRPPEASLGAKVILICFLIAVLFVIGTSFAGIFFCALKKNRKISRWNAPARSDSYEKIEMNRKPDTRPFHSEENGYFRNHHEGGIAIVNPTKKYGDYRNIPTEDDGNSYEDSELNGCNTVISQKNHHRWKGASLRTPLTINCDETDLHIPCLVDTGPAGESVASSTSGHPDTSIRQTSSIFTQPKQTWTAQLLNKNQQHQQQHHLKSDLSSSSIFCQQRSTVDTENLECENKYPDLLEVSIFGDTSTIDTTQTTSPFCTLPRKIKNSNTKYYRKSSESQSPLLPSESFGSNSKYGNITIEESTAYLSDSSNRRLSAESAYTNYTFLKSNQSIDESIYQRQRSSSYLNLVPITGTTTSSISLPSSSNSTNHNQNHSSNINNGNGDNINHNNSHHNHNNNISSSKIYKKNPSLPSSPVREPPSRIFSSAATPLLDFSTLTSRSPPLLPSQQTPSSSSTSTSAVAAAAATLSSYDYHAAQLERFLEEYRNLQEQLCKMKETCESIRQKEAPFNGALGHSAQLADPLMYNAALSGNNMVMEPPDPKNILKSKPVLPSQPPDPPPYWLHRNALLKRLTNDSQSQFYKS